MVLSANYPIMDVQNKYLFVLLYQVHLDWKVYPSKLADRNKVKDEKTRNIYFKGKCLYRSLPDKRNPNFFISREITLGSYFLHRELTSHVYFLSKNDLFVWLRAISLHQELTYYMNFVGKWPIVCCLMAIFLHRELTYYLSESFPSGNDSLLMNEESWQKSKI